MGQGHAQGTRTRSGDTARSKHEKVANSEFALYNVNKIVFEN